MRRGKTIGYWIATAFVAFIMTVSGGLALSHTPRFMTALAHLGYPAYFSDLLGVGKLIGVAVLLAPGAGRLKEWAYAAFGIVVLSACYSHLLSGDGVMALEPLVTGAALVVSYVLRPADRRMAIVARAAARVSV
jgi:DoxX-like protein